MGAIKVFWADLDRSSILPDRVKHVLDERERARAERFHADRDRARFVQRRFLLRRVLSDHLGCDPAAFDYRIGPYGKLSLPRPAPNFSASHSHGLALFALAPSVALGCDVERASDEIDVERTAERFFAPGERHDIEQAPPGARRRLFFQYWTKKEAYLKATGAGLSQSLASFDLSAHAVPGWSFHALELLAGFCAAIAAQTTCIQLTSSRLDL